MSAIPPTPAAGDVLVRLDLARLVRVVEVWPIGPRLYCHVVDVETRARSILECGQLSPPKA